MLCLLTLKKLKRIQRKRVIIRFPLDFSSYKDPLKDEHMKRRTPHDRKRLVDILLVLPFIQVNLLKPSGFFTYHHV